MNASIPAVSDRHSHALRLAAFAVTAAAAWIAVVAQAPMASSAAEYRSLPALPVIEGACAATREQAADHARAAEAAALGAIARYPFDPSRGLRALSRLADAERCFLDAHDAASAARVAARAGTWRARVDRDYRDHGTRYRLALASGRTQRALADVDFLLALLDQHGGAFAEHLRRAQDTLTAQSVHVEEAR